MFFALINATSSSTGAVVEDEGTPAVVQAQTATVAGSGTIVRDASGSVTAAAATSSGLMFRIITASGTATAQTALASGGGSVNAGTSPVIVDGAGAAQAQAASTSGVLTILSTIIADVTAQPATVDVTMAFSTLFEVDAEVFAGDATVENQVNDDFWVDIRIKASTWRRIYPNG